MVCGNVEQINTAIKAVAERWTRNSEPVTPAAPSEASEPKTWEPGLASNEIEEGMECADVPESDRDEVRRFSEFLQRRTDRKAGIEVGPAPSGMKEWLTGNPPPSETAPAAEPREYRRFEVDDSCCTAQNSEALARMAAAEPAANKTTQSGTDVGIAGRELPDEPGFWFRNGEMWVNWNFVNSDDGKLFALDRLSESGHFTKRILTANAPRGNWRKATAASVKREEVELKLRQSHHLCCNYRERQVGECNCVAVMKADAESLYRLNEGGNGDGER
jgi:hypothetical protein